MIQGYRLAGTVNISAEWRAITALTVRPRMPKVCKCENTVFPPRIRTVEI
jgi:hypothetical protein